jgi:hypothetical protein
MASPPQLRTTESRPTPEAYRPVSVLAIAGLSIAVLQTVLILSFAVNALLKATPLVDPWILPFALVTLVAGALVSLLAWWQIRQSEGTRAGLALAKWGWWLSLLSGLGYLAYYFAIDAAVGLDAKKFTDKWFDKLREGDLNGAFVLTRDPERQKNISPNNPEDMKPFTVKGPHGYSDLQQFESKDLIRFVLQGGKKADVQSLGVREWEYNSDAKTYQVKLGYRVKTPEGSMDCLVTVKGSNKSGGRQWQVTDASLAGNAKLSDLGLTVDAWSNQSAKVATGFLLKLAAGHTWEAYLDQVEPRERERLRAEFAVWNRQHLAAWAASLPAAGPACAAGFPAGSELARTVPPPSEGYRQFVEGKFLTGQEAFLVKEPAEKELQEDRLRSLLSLFRGPTSEWRMVHPRSNQPLFRPLGRMAMWKREPAEDDEDPNGRMRLTHRYQLFLVPVVAAEAGAGQKEPPRNRTYDVNVVVESDRGPITLNRKPNWRIVGLEMLDGGEAMPNPSRGPPGAPEGGGPMPMGLGS